MEGFWLRLPHYSSVRPTKSEESVSLLVGIQPRHYYELGVTSQDLLTGSGLYDSHVVQAEIDHQNWSYNEALNHCCEQLRDFKSRTGATTEASRSQTILKEIEAADFVRLGKPCMAPNGGAVQEILIEQEHMKPLMLKARNDIWPFLIVKEIALTCLERRNMDVQPTFLMEFAYLVLSGRIKPQGKVPKHLAYVARDGFIRALLNGLKLHGIKPTRNDASPPTSGCDILADASRAAGLTGLTSYQRIKDIYLKG